MAVPLVDLRAAHRPLREELRAAFDRVLDSGRFVSGQEVERLEATLAQRVGTTHAVAVGSGTAALVLTLLAAGIGPGDEVILPANTFFATAEAVAVVGATPVLADVELTTASLDPEWVAYLVTARTAAIVAVHLYGTPADTSRLRQAADGHHVLIVEDAAQAMGASWGGRRVGSLGDAAAFSFFPTKNLGALGEGGAITTSDEQLARRARLLRSHGEAAKNVHVALGGNERLDELQAALLMVKLDHLDEDLECRRAVVAYYRGLLRQVPGVTLLHSPAAATPAQHLMVVRVDDRDRVLADLRAEGVAAAVHYPTPVHLQPAFEHLGLGTARLPNVEELARTVLSLPLYPQMTAGQVERCVEALANAVAR